ncbi:MAG: hypothetical protein OEZ34_09515 [Spirochaetia bacterium]|nr:hypothetical protein [Spirochaetia bacterium]
MMRPIDMHVAFNAIPDFARMNSGEQASMMYRQVQALNDARNENLIRPEKVVHVPERTGAALNPDSIPVLKKKSKDRENDLKLYAPDEHKTRGMFGLHSNRRDRLGHYFDATA